MKTLEQIRARNAMQAAEQNLAGANGGEVIKKIPPLIMNHGLLAVGAYAFDEKTGYKGAVDAIARHLADPAIALVPQWTTAQKQEYRRLDTELPQLKAQLRDLRGQERKRVENEIAQKTARWIKVSEAGCLLDYLTTEADADKLKQCTTEAMAWLNYARRFIKKG